MKTTYAVVPVAVSTFMATINCLAVRNVISFPTLGVWNVTGDMPSVRLQMYHSQNTQVTTYKCKTTHQLHK